MDNVEGINTNAKETSLDKRQNQVLSALIILFVIVSAWGIYSGIADGQSRATYRQVDNLNTALKYYFQDQDRYPTVDQFYNQKILTPNYLASMPKPEDASGSCGKYPDFIYSQKTSATFSLEFCLRSGVNGLSAGPHILTENSLR